MLKTGPKRGAKFSGELSPQSSLYRSRVVLGFTLAREDIDPTTSKKRKDYKKNHVFYSRNSYSVVPRVPNIT